jgi:uncharacterized membrane protein
MNAVPNPVAPYRRVPASHGASWWVQGWRSFLRAPWAWAGLSLALVVCSVILHKLPMGGALAQWLSMPVFTLGAVFASVLRRRWARARSITPEGLAAEADNEGAFGESSRQWSSRLGTLLLASLLVLLAIVAVLLVLGLALSLLFGVGLMHMEAIGHMMEASPGAVMAGIGMGAGTMVLGALLVLAALLACSVAFWFVGTLVALGGLGAWDAIRLSARAAFANLGALVVFTLLLIPLGIAATLPVGLGWLVLLPMISGASYASYDDVFGPPAPTYRAAVPGLDA